jgi:D-amino-acid dehydrogenase
MNPTRQQPIVIIGGGVIGVCCAYFLAKKGLPVVVFEKNELGSGCSFGNMGLLAPSHSIPLAAPGVIPKAIRWMFNDESPFAIRWRLDRTLFGWLWQFLRYSVTANLEASTRQLLELTRASMELYTELADHAGMAFGQQHLGLLELFVSNREFNEMRHTVELLRKVGLRVETLGPREVNAMEPMASATVCGGLFYEEDCHMLPDLFVRGLAARAQAAGAIFHERTEIAGLRCENGRVLGANTPTEFREASVVILAAGSASPELAKKLGVTLPVIPGRGYSFTIPRETNWPERPLMLAEAKVLLTPMADTLRIGGTLQLTDANASPSSKRARSITKRLGEYLQAQIDCDRVQPWCGDRPCSPDGLPIIGWSKRYSNLFYATGHGMLGMTHGPITGKFAAQMLLGEVPSEYPTAWAPERFGNVM